MNKDYKIEGDTITLKLIFDIKIESLEKIIKYLKQTDLTFGIQFYNTHIDTMHNKLILDTEHKEYYYSDCQTLFYLGILQTTNYSGITEFYLREDANVRLTELKRSIKLKKLLN